MKTDDELSFFDDIYNIIEFKNCTIKKQISLSSVTRLEIKDNTTLKDELTISENTSDIIIQNSSILKNVNFKALNNLIKIESSNLNNLEIESSHNLELDNVNIKEDITSNKNVNVKINNSTLSNIKLNSSKILEMYNIKNLKNFTSNGNSVDNIKIENSEILEQILINQTSLLELNNIKSNPNLNLTFEQYKKIDISNTYLNNFIITSFVSLTLKDTNINGEFSIQNSNNSSLKLEKVKLFQEISFPRIETFNMIDSTIKGNLKFNSLKSLDINNSIIEKDLDFIENTISTLLINSSTLKGNIDFKKSKIDSITFNSNKKETKNKNLFESTLDFSESILKDIEIRDSIFNNDILLNNIKKPLQLFNIKDINIKGKLSITESKINNLFEESININIKELNIDCCDIDKSFNTDTEIIFKKLNIEQFICNQIIFKKDVIFLDMNIDKFRLANTNIENSFKIKYSNINSIIFISNTFEDLQIIDNHNDNFENERELKLRNTTIKSTVLDKLQYNNFKMDKAHVSDAKIGQVYFKNGSRETNRFFKNYYDSISDYIQANKYYRDEMESQLTSNTTRTSEKLILNINKFISDFGQDWFNPLLLLFFLTVFFCYVPNHESFTTVKMYDYNPINILLKSWNGFWEFLNPFSKSASKKYQDWYGWWMIHKLLSSILIYHFIIAVKRKTKR